MASNIDFVEYICSKIEGTGTIRYRMMFGEYMIYVDEKPLILICDNTAYVKMHPDISELMHNAEQGAPYEGAKAHYILDVENRDVLLKVVNILKSVLPYPKRRKKSKS